MQLEKAQELAMQVNESPSAYEAHVIAIHTHNGLEYGVRIRCCETGIEIGFSPDADDVKCLVRLATAYTKANP